MKSKVLILTGVGINSNRELAEAFDLAGAESKQLHISELEDNPKKVFDYQLIAFPGGFSYGDHIASGKILSHLLKAKLSDHFQELKEKATPMLGICNGFQILVKLGLLPQTNGNIIQEASLIHNDSGQYEDRWVNLQVDENAKSKSPWFNGIDELFCPVRHGEGKLVLSNESELSKLKAANLIALRYSFQGQTTQTYPHNPNGSWDAIAGLIDPSGLIFGLMPHPEVAIHNTQLPNWTRTKQSESYTTCLQLFKNIVQFIKTR